MYWREINQYHQPSHTNDYLAIEDLDEPSVHSVMADHFADEYYSPDQPFVDNNDLAGYLEGYFCHQNHPVTALFCS